MSRIYSVEFEDDSRNMHSRGYGRKRSRSNLHGETEETDENLGQYSRCPSRESNRTPYELRSEALPLQ